MLRASGLLQLLLVSTSVGLTLTAGVSFGTPGSDLVGYLGGGTARNEGWLQLYVDGMWVTVCGRNWTYPLADYTCRRLGFEGVRPDGWDVHLGAGTGPPWCPDAEAGELAPCPSEGVDVCTHSDDVGLRCEWDPEPEDFLNRLGYIFRLTGPAVGQGKGRLEVFYDNEWGTLCSRGWTEYFADAVCKHLGYRGVQDNGWNLPAEPGSGPVVCSEIFSLAVCPEGGDVTAGEEACTHSHDVGVKCEADGDGEDMIASSRDMEMARLGIVVASSVLVTGGLLLPLLACYLAQSPGRRISEDLENLIGEKGDHHETRSEVSGPRELGKAAAGEENEGYAEEKETGGEDSGPGGEVEGQALKAREEEINSAGNELGEMSCNLGAGEATSGCKETNVAGEVTKEDGKTELEKDADVTEAAEPAENSPGDGAEEKREDINPPRESITPVTEDKPHDGHVYEAVNEDNVEKFVFSMHGEHALNSVYF